jgi:hypothetical protein
MSIHLCSSCSHDPITCSAKNKDITFVVEELPQLVLDDIRLVDAIWDCKKYKENNNAEENS